MSDLNYYAHPTANRLPHRGGLTAWGVVMIVIGSFFAFSGVGSVVIMSILASMRSGSAKPEWVGLMLVTCLFNCTLGGVLIWVGVGCCRGRRWVRPLLLAGGGVASVTGALTVVPVSLMLAHGFNRAPATGQPQLPKGVTIGMTVVGLLFSILFMIGLPAAVVAWFRRESVGHTLAVLDPVSRWTDAVPVTVLAWMLACLYLGGGVVMGAFAGVWFWFKVTVVGWAAISGAAVGIAIVIAGLACYRRSAVAWATAVALFGLLAASAITFVIAGDTSEYDRRLTNQTNAFAGSFTPPPPTTGPTTGPATGTTTHVFSANVQGSDFAEGVNPEIAPALLYLAAFGYGLWIRRRVVGTDRGEVPQLVELTDQTPSAT